MGCGAGPLTVSRSPWRPALPRKASAWGSVTRGAAATRVSTRDSVYGFARAAGGARWRLLPGSSCPRGAPTLRPCARTPRPTLRPMPDLSPPGASDSPIRGAPRPTPVVGWRFSPVSLSPADLMIRPEGPRHRDVRWDGRDSGDGPYRARHEPWLPVPPPASSIPVPPPTGCGYVGREGPGPGNRPSHFGG